MLKPQRHCAVCGTEMVSVRSTKSFCSDACRKKAARGRTKQQPEHRWIVECLRRMCLVAKIWPVYSWDTSPAIFALMVTREAALGELNFYGDIVTEGELERALRDCGIETSNGGERLRAEIRAFYDARKDRRIKKGYTPSDNGESAP
jgi:predicted nucleic acid-binding Zn ribbon protein